MIEHVNTINALYAQITSLLDLMMMCENSVDIQSIKTASEMCTTMLDEMKDKIDKIEIEWKQNKSQEACYYECETCRHLHVAENEEPCINCKSNYVSKWKAR